MRYQRAPLGTASLPLFTAPVLAQLSSRSDHGAAPATFSRWVSNFHLVVFLKVCLLAVTVWPLSPTNGINCLNSA